MVHQAILKNESLPRVESLSPLMHNDQVEGAGNINLRALRNASSLKTMNYSFLATKTSIVRNHRLKMYCH